MTAITRGAIVALVALSAACAARAEVQTPTGDPALVPPTPPARVVVPAPEQPTLPMPEPMEAASSPAATPNRPATPQTRPVPPPVTPPVSADPPPPPAILSTVVSADFENRIRIQLDQAVADLTSVDRRMLGADAKAQFDAAQGFIRQCREALKVRNLIFAGQLADKAATMAALLKR